MRSKPWRPARAAAAAVAVLAVLAVRPATATPLQLPQALELALQANRELAAARHDVGAAAAAREQAAARPNPLLEFGLEGTRRVERETTVQLAQPIELGGKRAARTAAADFAAEAARQRLAARSAELRVQVTLAFHEALLARARVQLADASLGLARAGMHDAVTRLQAGKAAPVEETRAKLAEAGARLELAQAQSLARSALLQLAGAIGEPGRRIEAVEGVVALPPLPDEQAVPRLLQDAPAVRQAALEAERLQALAQLARAQRVPDLTLSLGARREDASGHTRALIGLAIPLPVFDTRRPAEAEALHRAGQALDAAAMARIQLEAQVAQAIEKLRHARLEVLMIDDELLPGAEAARRAASRGYELGKWGIAETLNAQRALIQTRHQRLRALSDAHAAAAELQRLLGTDFEAR